MGKSWESRVVYSIYLLIVILVTSNFDFGCTTLDLVVPVPGRSLF